MSKLPAGEGGGEEEEEEKEKEEEEGEGVLSRRWGGRYLSVKGEFVEDMWEMSVDSRI